jgi:hypothetical protein
MVFAGGLEVAVEHGGVEVQAVGPCHGAAFWINLDLREVQRIVKGSERPFPDSIRPRTQVLW